MNEGHCYPSPRDTPAGIRIPGVNWVCYPNHDPPGGLGGLQCEELCPGWAVLRGLSVSLTRLVSVFIGLNGSERARPAR